MRHKSRLSASIRLASSEFDRGSCVDDFDNTDDSGISMGNSEHSRRASDVQSLRQTSLPSVGPLLSETGGGYGYSPWTGRDDDVGRH